MKKTEDEFGIRVKVGEDKATYAVIWLHGLGADGNDFVPIVSAILREKPALETLGIEFIFPHAPFRPVTLNRGAVMRAWYDIDDLALVREDENGVKASASFIETLVESLKSQGIPSKKIVLAGFSQGGAIALYAGLTQSREAFGGILALSTYLPIASIFEKSVQGKSFDTPVLMIHGTQDSVISLQTAQKSHQKLKQLGCPIEFQTYPMDHTVCQEEVEIISHFLFDILNR